MNQLVFLPIFLIISLIIHHIYGDWSDPTGGARIGTLENFDDIIASNDMVLVNFYAPWCGHSKKLLPEFDAAADALASESFEGQDPVLLKIDLVEHEDLYFRFDIKGFPSVRLFRNGEEVDEVFHRTEDALINYIRKRVDYRPKEFKTAEAITDFAARGKWNGEKFEESPSVIAFLDEDSTNKGENIFETFTNVACKFSKQFFIHMFFLLCFY